MLHGHIQSKVHMQVDDTIISSYRLLYRETPAELEAHVHASTAGATVDNRSRFNLAKTLKHALRLQQIKKYTHNLKNEGFQS